MKLNLPIFVSAASLVFAGVASAGTVTFDKSVLAPTGATSAVYFGTGNPNGGWTVDTEATGIELGLRVKNRGDIQVIDSPNGTYTVHAGSNGGYAFWNLEYSIDLQPATGPNSGRTNASINATLLLADVTNPNSITLNPIATAPGPFNITDDGQVTSLATFNGTTDGHTNSDTAYGSQNSENLRFFTAAGFNVNALDVYTLTLDVTDRTSGRSIASDSITINAVAPEPATMLLVPCAGIAMFLLRRKRSA